MEKIEQLKELSNYYKNNGGLLIVGLNDSQGVNINTTFFKKGLLDYIAGALENEMLKPLVINAFSLTMNKTEHIDYFLNNDLSVEEIKLSQIYSAISAIEKVMTDFHLPKCLGQIGNLYRLVYTQKKEDKEIHITTALQETKEPIMIYSSGVNDLMREVGADPVSIGKYYRNRSKKPNYDYTLEKTNDPNTLKKVMGAIEKNYNTILSINPNIDVYTLGAYVPKSLQHESMNIFRELVITYNEELSHLCNQYGITFVDTENIGKEYNHSEFNFHISSSGHNVLANHILWHMYQNKIGNNQTIEQKENKDGLKKITKRLLLDYELNLLKAEELEGYASKRELDIAMEHRREIEIVQKVYKHKMR